MATNVGWQARRLRRQGERPPAWTRVGGIALPLLAVAVLGAIRPEIVRGTFSSPESILRVGAVLVAWVLFSRLSRRFIANPLVRAVVIAVPAIALLWWNVAPYFEEDVKIAGSFPESSVPATTLVPLGPLGPSDAQPVAPVPATPVRLTAGRFRGLDGHRGSGEASILRLTDGSHVVAFRDLSVSSVPDPVVYLVPGADKEDVGGGTRLGRLDASKDRYGIPAGTDFTSPVTVLVWCQRFAVPVAGATQQPA